MTIEIFLNTTHFFKTYENLTLIGILLSYSTVCQYCLHYISFHKSKQQNIQSKHITFESFSIWHADTRGSFNETPRLTYRLKESHGESSQEEVRETNRAP